MFAGVNRQLRLCRTRVITISVGFDLLAVLFYFPKQPINLLLRFILSMAYLINNVHLQLLVHHVLRQKSTVNPSLWRTFVNH